jgi:hypothetical protein
VRGLVLLVVVVGPFLLAIVVPAAPVPLGTFAPPFIHQEGDMHPAVFDAPEVGAMPPILSATNLWMKLGLQIFYKA